MCEYVDFKKLAGKSCLVCRRRKVKCDKTKPVCLACVKHKSADECVYDNNYKSNFSKDNSLPPKSPNMASGIPGACAGGLATKLNAQRKSSENSSRGILFSRSHRSRLLSEIESLRKNLSSLEQLIETRPSSDPATSEFSESDDDPLSEALRGLPPMSFRNYEMISMRNGKMALDGPLSYRSFALEDPFLALLIKRAHLNSDSKVNKGNKRRKVVHSEYEGESASVLFSQGIRDLTSTGTGDLTVDKSNDNKADEIDKGNFDESSRNINKGMLQGKKSTDKPLSMKHILNETEGNEFIGNGDKNRDFKKQESLPPSECLKLWKGIRAILDNLAILRNSNLTYELSQSNLTVQEQLFGYSPVCQKTPEREILIRIQALLPPEKAVWLLIKNYFRSPIHGLYPVLSEKWFIESIQTLIGPNKDRETPPTVSVSERLDFADLGLLMCVLALSNMALMESTNQNPTKEEKYLLSQPTREGLIDIAQMCMGLFKLLRKPILPIFYCGLLIRIFRRFARNEGDSIEGEDTSSFTGLIVEVAYGLGMNIDLKKSNQFAEHEVYLHQWRKNWYLVFLLATDEALTSGNCLIIDEKSYTTELPSIHVDDQGNFPSFVTNPSLEVASVNCMRRNYELALVHQKALKYVTNKSDLIGCEKIQRMLDELESATALACGPSLVTILAKPADKLECSVVKLTSFKGFIRSKALILLITTALFVHVDGIEEKGSDSHQARLSIDYVKKLISIYMDLEPVLILLYFGYDHTSDSLHRMFGSGSEVIVIQACVEFLAKFVPVLYIVLSRCLHLQFTYMNNQKDEQNTHAKVEGQKMLSSLDAIVNKIIDKLSHVNAIISKLSQFNFQVWKISKSSLFMYTLLKNQSDNLFNYLPNSNTVKTSNWNDLQEIYALLCYASYGILVPYVEQEKLETAQNLRIQTSNNNTTMAEEKLLKPNGLFEAQFIARTTQNEALAGFDQLQQRRFFEDGNETPEGAHKLTAMGWLDENKIISFDDVDQLWAESILRTANTSSAEEIPNLAHRRLMIPPATVQCKGKADTESCELAESLPILNAGSQGVHPQEFLKNQILLQECIIKQLQQVTTEHLQIFESIGQNYNDAN